MQDDIYGFETPRYDTDLFPTPREFQVEAHEALRQGVRDGHKAQVLMAPTGSGKCLGRDTPVLMADGSVKMVQDVRVGDRLIGPDGGVRNVLSVSSGREMLYRVTPTKGDSYVVNSSHILSLKKTPGSGGLCLVDGSYVSPGDDVVNVNVKTFARSNRTVRHCLKGWRSPAIESFVRDEDEDNKERTIPPYILGAWLGDGTEGRASITKPRCKMVDAWISYGESVEYGVVVQEQPDRCPSWLLTNGRDGNSYNIVQSDLALLGVLRNKHVPSCYRFGPLSVRKEVVAGMIDSDGSVTNGGVDWISKSKQLADDFAFMCRSVGLACYLSRQLKGIRETGFEGYYWRASVSGDLSSLPMLDKVSKPRKQKKRHLVHGITVEPIGEGDYFGFEIDGDHLFLLGDFTVTHNTFLGLRVIHEALKKGRRALFVCDRTTLIDQTSAVADSYGLGAHGIIQAKHWRTESRYPFQIASVQTLARRTWPESDVIVIDEAHALYSSWVEHVKTTKAMVIGLSATPFSKGMGRIFSNLINAATMADLVASGVLVPMRVLSCARINMDGAETIGGEWTDHAAETRGMEIIGDVVGEWSAHANNAKTIVFGATIKHCEEMCRQFNEAGIMAAVFTSHTTPEERKELLDEYKKTDSAIRVLVSVEALCVDDNTEILTRRGWASIDDISEDDLVASYDSATSAISFDKPKNVIKRRKGIAERMVSVETKRISLRVTEGHRMIVPLGEKVSVRRWQFRSAGDCVGVNGLDVPVSGHAEPELMTVVQEATSETSIGRRIAANSYALRKQGMSYEAARQEAVSRIWQRQQLRFKSPRELTEDECRMIGFWLGDGSTTKLSRGGVTYAFSQSKRYQHIVGWFDSLLSRLGVQALRYEIKKEKIRKATADVVRWNVPRGTGFGEQKRNGIYSLEPYLDKDGTDLFWGLGRDQYLALIEGLDMADGIHYRHASRPETNPRIANTNRKLLDLLQAIGVCRGCRVSITSGNTKRANGYKPLYMMSVNPDRQYTCNAFKKAEIGRGNSGEMVWCVETANGTIVTRRNGVVTIMGNCKGFDVRDVGCVCDCRPLRKSLSTAIQMWGRGLRASAETGKTECLLLDFSGNIVRFADDFSDIYFNGLAALDAGEKLDKSVRQDPLDDEERDGKACPSCGYKPMGRRCVACGHEARSNSQVEHLPGKMTQIELFSGKGTKLADDPLHLWRQIAGYVVNRSAPEKQQGRAAIIFRDITGNWPPRDWQVNSTEPAPITKGVANFIQMKNIAYAKARQKARA